jgi:ribonuclease HI
VKSNVTNYKLAKHVDVIAKAAVQKTEVLISWKPPPVGWVRLNTDGSCKEGNRAGCGGLVRGSEGEWLGGFPKFVGSCSACIAELWGVLEGLRCIWNLGFHWVELHIDSQVVINMIKEDKMVSSTCWSIVCQIRRLLQYDWEIRIQHSYRKANRCADMLANMECDRGGALIFYESCPISLSSLYKVDIIGVATPRFIAL